MTHTQFATKDTLEHVGWGLVGEPRPGVLVETGNGLGLDVAGYSAWNYWDAAGKFRGPDAFGVVPVYRCADGSIYPEGAREYPYSC